MVETILKEESNEIDPQKIAGHLGVPLTPGLVGEYSDPLTNEILGVEPYWNIRIDCEDGRTVRIDLAPGLREVRVEMRGKIEWTEIDRLMERVGHPRSAKDKWYERPLLQSLTMNDITKVSLREIRRDSIVLEQLVHFFSTSDDSQHIINISSNGQTSSFFHRMHKEKYPPGCTYSC